MSEHKQVNFTIVPDQKGDEPRTYANFCAVAHTPFDFTLTFCEVMPLTEHDVKNASDSHEIKAQVRARMVVPVQFIPSLIAALQEHMRVYSESTAGGPEWNRGPVH
jgi:hypothetical protein